MAILSTDRGDPSAIDLRRAKRRPLLLLGAAALVFAATVFWPYAWLPGAVVGALKAMSEAAMVGALADWFAVTALFRDVPIPFVRKHTGVVPRNKDRIAGELAVFMHERFLGADALVNLLRRHDRAVWLAAWLGAPDNAQRLGRYAVRLLSILLGLADDARIQGWVREGLRTALGKVDLSQSAGALLDTLTRDGRHQELLDQLLDQLGLLLREESANTFVAAHIVEGLKSEFPKAEKLLPSAWIGEQGARVLESAVSGLLRQVSQDHEHQLRRRFDEIVQKLIAHLKTDPAFLRKGQELKASLREGGALNDYAFGLWANLRAWLREDLERPDSALHARVCGMGRWLGETLAADAGLRASFNGLLEDLARAWAPDLARTLVDHIGDTVRHWDARETARLIELKIGKDLQKIRINGTLLGGMIGLVLYLFSYLPQGLAWLRVQAGL